METYWQPFLLYHMFYSNTFFNQDLNRAVIHFTLFGLKHDYSTFYQKYTTLHYAIT